MTRNDEIQARLDAITPGDWKAAKVTVWRKKIGERSYQVAADNGMQPVCSVNKTMPEHLQYNNANFIAHGPKDMVHLLGENERFRKALESIGHVYEVGGLYLKQIPSIVNTATTRKARP